MSDSPVLSQREIDALLTASNEEEPAAAADAPITSGLRGDLKRKPVKRYDFRRPDKFSKDQLRTLQAVHETFARLAASTLSNQLRTNVNIKVSSIDQGLYEEYVAQVAPPTFITTLRMAPLEGSVLVQFGQEIGLTVVDRMLGGTGTLLEYQHEVTDIELQLLRGVAALIADDLGEAWENLASVQPTVAELHEDVQYAALAPPTEVVIMVFMEVTLLSVVAVLSVCTPYSVLEPVLPRLTAQVWAGAGGRRSDFERGQRRLRTQIQRTPATVRVRLGSAEIPGSELSHMGVGDVIRLDAPVGRPVSVCVGDVRKWFGQPGLVGNRVAIELQEWAPEELPPPLDAKDEAMPETGNQIESLSETPSLPSELPTAEEESEISRAA